MLTEEEYSNEYDLDGIRSKKVSVVTKYNINSGSGGGTVMSGGNSVQAVVKPPINQPEKKLISKTTKTHTYLTQNGKVMRDTLNTTVLQTKITRKTEILDFIYDESGRPFALIYTKAEDDPVTYYYVLNLQGDVVGLVDENGVFVAQYTYNAWGEILDISGDMAAINPLRYRGYYYDTETGWYYLQSRYYDPANHRFINADSYASTNPMDAISCNMFAYCENNPVNLSDNSGHAGELTAGWAGSMWWLPFIDGPIPIGEIIYFVGCLACGIADLISYFGADNIVLITYGVYDVYNSAKHGGGSFSQSAAGSSPATPPNGNNNNRNERDYIKAGSNTKANNWARRAGADSAEALKREFVGNDGSRFDMYLDRTTDEIILISKSSGLVISTGYYLP